MTFKFNKDTNVKVHIFSFLIWKKNNLILIFWDSYKKTNILFRFRHLDLFRIQTNSGLFRFQTKKQTPPYSMINILSQVLNLYGKKLWIISFKFMHSYIWNSIINPYEAKFKLYILLSPKTVVSNSYIKQYQFSK